eukprot:1193669-Prorocentrum_minimum.AAC.1
MTIEQEVISWITFVLFGMLGLFCMTVLVLWVLWYLKRFDDPFNFQRDRFHNPDDPDQEIDPRNIASNPAWRGKVCQAPAPLALGRKPHPRASSPRPQTPPPRGPTRKAAHRRESRRTRGITHPHI